LLKRVFIYCQKLTRKEALWLVSNIAANSEEDANALADSLIIGNLLSACRDSSVEMRKEAVWALSNTLNLLHDKDRIERLISMDIMATLLELLQKDEDSGSIASLALSTVNYLLNKSDTAKVVFMRLGGPEVAGDLQLSKFHEVYKLASEILERHCGAQEMDPLEKMEFINSK